MRTDPDFGGVIGRTWRESTPWWPETPAAPPGAPNVVFVLLDDVGFADLGCYGSEIATPHIDRLAAGGLRYTNFHTTAMCSPTRACLLTGRNAHSVGMGIIAEWSSGFPGYHGKYSQRVSHIVRSDATVPPGRHSLRVEFAKTGERRGRATLMTDGQRVGSVDIPSTWPAHGLTAGLH